MSDDFKFLYWDDPGDSQENVDKQCTCKPWEKEIMRKELGLSCCRNKAEIKPIPFDYFLDHEASAKPYSNHASQQEEDEAVNRMLIIMRNGNEGLHYDDYEDYTEEE
jgi:hypothetical protein